VILVDATLLVYAHVAGQQEHAAARAWLDERLNGDMLVGLPWPSLLAFVRLVSNPRIFEQPLTVGVAWRQVEEWLDCAPVWVPQPTERHQAVLGGLLRDQTFRANLVPDAHLAALAMEHGLTLCSTDGDFARFQGLRWENPLRP
jgi:toxin-antitoxin system PIN domain toxin